MVSSFGTILSILFLTVSNASAAPWTRVDHTRHATHRFRHINQGLTIESYHPSGSYKVRLVRGDWCANLLILCHRRPSGLQGFKPLQLQRLLLLPLLSQEVAPLPLATLLSASMTLPLPLFNHSLASTLLSSDIEQALHLTNGDMRMLDSIMYGRSFFLGCILLTERQNDIPIANAVGNIAWFDDKIVAFGNSFIDANTGMFNYSVTFSVSFLVLLQSNLPRVRQLSL